MPNPEANDWYVLGADEGATHQGILYVEDNDFQTPAQKEIFEPLGASRKTIVRGNVLGDEGTLQCVWPADEVADALVMLAYLIDEPGPHTLYSPYGDEWLVEFGTITKKYRPAGHLVVTLPWTQVE